MTTEDKKEKPSSEKKESKKRFHFRWKRWAITTLVVLIALRVVLALLLPPLISRVASSYHFKSSYERLQLSLLGGDFALYGLKLTPENASGKDGDQALISAEYVRASIAPWQVLRGRLEIWRLEADGIDVTVERQADGKMPLLEMLVSGQSSSKTTVATKNNPADVDFTSPLKIEAFRLQRVNAHVIDRSVTPMVDTQVKLDARVSDLGDNTRPAQFDVNLSLGDILESMTVKGQIANEGRHLDAKMAMQVWGLHPKPMAGYLIPRGYLPVADSLSLRMNVSVKVDPNVSSTQVADRNKTGETGIHGQLTINDVEVRADREAVVTLKQLLVDVQKFDDHTFEVGSVQIDGAKGLVERTAGSETSEAHLKVLGVELIPPTVVEVTKTAPTNDIASVGNTEPWNWSVREVVGTNISGAFRDQLVRQGVHGGASNLAVLIDQFKVQNLGVSTRKDAATPGQPITVHLQGSLPGISKSWQLDTVLQPEGEHKTLAMDCHVEGINPQVLQPYLAQWGVVSELQNASFHAAVDGVAEISPTRFAGDARIKSLRFSDAGQTLLALDNVQTSGVLLDLGRGKLALREFIIQGPVLKVGRRADGTFAALGVRTGAPKSVPATAPMVSVVTTRPLASPVTKVNTGFLRSFRLDHFLWHKVQVKLEDQTVKPAAVVEIGDWGLELKNIAWNKDGKVTPETGTVRGWMVVSGMVGDSHVDGTLLPSVAKLQMNLQVRGDGLNAQPLAGYLRALGIEPTLKTGNLVGAGQIMVGVDNGEVIAGIDVEKVAYRDGEKEWLTLDHLKVGGLRYGNSGLKVEEISVNKPILHVERLADGALLWGGLSYRPVVQNAVTPAKASSDIVPAGSGVGLSFPAIELGQLNIRGSEIHWHDDAALQVVQTSLDTEFTLKNLVLGQDHPTPAEFNMQMGVGDILGKLEVGGQLAVGNKAQSVKLAVTGKGLKTGSLAAYLPQGVELASKNGQLAGQLEAQCQQLSGGGVATALKLSDWDFREFEQPQPYLHCDRLVVDIPELNIKHGKLDAGAITVREISTQGVEINLKKMRDGSWNAAGLFLKPFGADMKEKLETSELIIIKPSILIGEKEKVVTTASTAPTVVTGTSHWVPKQRKVWPLVKVENLDLNLYRLHWHDETRPQGDLELANFTIHNQAPISLLGRDAEGQPPVQIQMQGRVEPLVHRLDLQIKAAPFALQPTAEFDLLVAEINGQDLAQLVPALANKIHGETLTHGQFTTKAEVQLDLSRRDPLDFDFTHNFGGEINIHDIAYRATPEGPILLGLNQIHAYGVRVDPGQAAVRIKAVEIAKPILRANLETDGLHMLGLVINNSTLAAVENAGTQPATQPLAQATSRPVQTVTAPSGITSQVAVDRILVSGLDVVLEDNVVKPSLVVPLNSLDVEVRDFTTRAFTEPLPVRFNAILAANKIPLPTRGKSGGLVGALGDMAVLASGKKIEAKPGTELRPLFTQATASGRVLFYPQFQGWTKSSLSGLELSAFDSEARRLKMTVSSGILDVNFDARSQTGTKAEILKTQTRAVITDLSLTEPENGPIVRHLHWKGGLDLAIGALQDAGGAITLSVPLDVKLRNGPGEEMVRRSEIRQAAINAASEVVMRALLSSPVKLVEGAASLVGGNSEHKYGTLDTLEISFGGGAAAWSNQDKQRLLKLVEKVQNDESLQMTVEEQLSPQDVTLAEARANPSREDCLVLLAQLRKKKQELLKLRDEAGAMVQAQWAAQGDEATTKTVLNRVVMIHQELGKTESAIDQICEILKPGAELQAQRRTRTSAIALARERMEQVRALIAANTDLPAQRRVMLVPISYKINSTYTTGGGRIHVAVVKTAGNSNNWLGFKDIWDVLTK